MNEAEKITAFRELVKSVKENSNICQKTLIQMQNLKMEEKNIQK